MKRWKIILPSLIATTSLPFVSLVGCGENPGPKPVLKEMTIKQVGGKEVPASIEINQEIKLAAFDDQGVVNEAKFDTNFPTITLDGNVVTGKEKGKATITCTADGHEKTSWDFEVTEPVPKKMVIKLVNGGAIPDSIEINQEIRLAAYDGEDVISGATFSSKSTTITLTNNNVVTGIAQGEAEITCTAEGYEKTSCKFFVTEIEYEEFITAPIDDFRQEKTWRFSEKPNAVEAAFTGFTFIPAAQWAEHTWIADDIQIDASVTDDKGQPYIDDWNCRIFNFVKDSQAEDDKYTFDILMKGESTEAFTSLDVLFTITVNDGQKEHTQIVGTTSDDKLTVECVNAPEFTITEEDGSGGIGTINVPRIMYQNDSGPIINMPFWEPADLDFDGVCIYQGANYSGPLMWTWVGVSQTWFKDSNGYTDRNTGTHLELFYIYTDPKTYFCNPDIYIVPFAE